MDRAPAWRQRLWVARTSWRERAAGGRRRRDAPDLFVTHAADPLLPTDGDDVLGYCLTHAQRRYLSRATWVVAADGNRALGLAAHQPVQSEVRLVLECLVDRRLPERVRRLTAEALIDGVECLARADGVHLLVVMLEPGVSRTPFTRRGFSTVAVDPWGAWMQKHLFGIPCAASRWVQ